MIDVHSHILPGIDDGAADWGESMQLARLAVQEGISAIVATPHHGDGRHANPASEVEALTAEFNARLEQEGIPLSAYPGQEIRIHTNLIQELESGTIMGLAHSRYLLIELPSGHCPDYTEELFHELMLKGYVPVIAHPERNSMLGNNPDLLAYFIGMGVLAQVTTHSLMGLFGRKIQRHTHEMLRGQLVHLLSSDAHGIGRRLFEFRRSFDLLAKKYGTAYANQLAHYSQSILNNMPIQTPTPEPARRKVYFGKAIF